MSDMREKIADIIDTECCDSVYGGITGTYDAADAIIDALPAIIADMVEPLEWEEYPENGAPVMARAITKFGTYFICDDTDDFSGLYCEFITHQGATWFGVVRAKTELLFQCEHEDDHTKLYRVPNAHNVATILAALGMKEGKGNE